MAQLPRAAAPPTIIRDLNSWQDFQLQMPLQVLLTDQTPVSVRMVDPAPLAALPLNAGMGSSDHHHHRSPSPPRGEEFAEFSAAKRKAHRRSISDSFSFIENHMGPYEFHPGSLDHPTPVTSKGEGSGGVKSGCEFDKYNDDQFMSMFNNGLVNEISGLTTSSSSNPSALSSGHYENLHYEGSTVLAAAPSNGVEQREEETTEKRKRDEVSDSSYGKDENKARQPQGAAGVSVAPGNVTVADPKRVKRILANRQSAQRSRIRKLHYISELERSVTALQHEVSMLTPRVVYLDHQRMILSVDNNALKARIAALAQDKIFKDAHQEALRKEIVRLKQVYYQKTAETSPVDTSFPQPTTIVTRANLCRDMKVTEQLIN